MLEHTIEFFRVGQNTIIDVLQAQSTLSADKAKLAVLQEKERLMLSVGYFSDLDAIKSKEELMAQSAPLNEYREATITWLERAKESFAVGEIDRGDREQAQAFVEDAEFKVKMNQQRLGAAPDALQLKNSVGTVDSLELLRVSLIRFGGVAVTLFLMSVLVPIYRYNIRLAAYYLACADTLTICKDSHVNNFGELLNLLTPAFTFDKKPKTPVDSVAAVLKNAASLVKRT